MAVDILCFGAHADDIEIGMGGTISKYIQLGKKIVLVDLTKANLSSNGDVSLRKKEAEEAANILGVDIRENLSFSDRDLLCTQEKIAAVVALIRKYQPRVVFSPYGMDRHPDHGACTNKIGRAHV